LDTIGPGDEHDSRRFREVMDGIRVRCGRGRPRTRPGEVSGDSAYDTRGGRAYLRRRGIKVNIKGSCPSKQLWPPAPRLFHRRWEVFLWL
jgi:hypothetical protein